MTPDAYDSAGRPVVAVRGRLGAIIGYRRADQPGAAIGPTPDDAYPRRHVRPLTEAERAALYRGPSCSAHPDGCPTEVRPIPGWDAADPLPIHDPLGSPPIPATRPTVYAAADAQALHAAAGIIRRRALDLSPHLSAAVEPGEIVRALDRAADAILSEHRPPEPEPERVRCSADALVTELAGILWPADDPEAEWTGDTLQWIGEAMERAGRRPRPTLAAIAEAVPEADEPPLCACGRGYAGHDPHEPDPSEPDPDRPEDRCELCHGGAAHFPECPIVASRRR